MSIVKAHTHALPSRKALMAIAIVGAAVLTPGVAGAQARSETVAPPAPAVTLTPNIPP